MRPQGNFRMYPKRISVAVTREGETVACVEASSLFGGRMTISKAQWLEIGRILNWKKEVN